MAIDFPPTSSTSSCSHARKPVLPITWLAGSAGAMVYAPVSSIRKGPRRSGVAQGVCDARCALHRRPRDRPVTCPAERQRAVVRVDDGAATGPTAEPGFVADYATQPGQTPAGAKAIMNGFDPARLPVMKTLATTSSCYCDRWFSSVPGQTWRTASSCTPRHRAVSSTISSATTPSRPSTTTCSRPGIRGPSASTTCPQTVTMASLRKKEYLTQQLQSRWQFHLDLANWQPAGVFLHRAALLRLPQVEGERPTSAARRRARRASHR